MTAQLFPTGERFLPELMPREIALEHQHLYYVAATLARNLDVLDVTPGKGYGARFLAEVAKSVVGVNVDVNAVESVARQYGSVPNLRFVEGACSLLPLPDASVDLVVGFEVIIEHGWNEAMLAEIKRVLRPGGVLVISSPDRQECSDVSDACNAVVGKECEFSELLSRSFASHHFYCQGVRETSMLSALENPEVEAQPIANFKPDDTQQKANGSSGIDARRYLVAVVSDRTPLPLLPVGAFAMPGDTYAAHGGHAEFDLLRQRADEVARELASAQTANRVALQEAKRLRHELSDWRLHASNLEDRIEAQDEALNDVVQRHAKSLKEAYERGVSDTRAKVDLITAPLEAQVASLRGAVADRDAQYQAILRSLSWRVTRPLRVGRRIAARLKAARVVEVNGPRTPVVNEDFDEVYYMRRYPDVAAGNMDPYQHYLMFGRVEGRSGRPPELILRESFDAKRAAQGADQRGTVLVVSHEATRTGAPILAWNIACELRKHYRVVVLLLGKGTLVEAFDEVADAVAGPYSSAERDALALTSVVAGLCSRFTFEFAIVNSLASRSVLQPLAENYVPTTLLVHEFFKFHCSADELVDAFAWAGQVVFSANIVRDSADIERTHPAVLRSHVLPQGKSQIPGDTSADTKGAGSLDAAARIAALEAKILGPRKRKPFIVLGAGTIEYRKGVDLFVATAAEIRRVAPDTDILMVWVGGVVEGHKQYADFVATQVEQAELEQHVEFVGETPDLEALYRFADLCFISSRLDPLPNIALDAAMIGLPVLSFERATGVAENFMGDALLEQCVVPFLNIEEAARRIVALYRQPAQHKALSARVSSLAAERFDMTRYVEKLVGFSQQGKQMVVQEKRDVDALLATSDFADWFYLTPDSEIDRAEAVREFVKSAQSGIYVRKPSPGFYPHRYVEHHDLGQEQVNPFVHYLNAGRPAGVWQEPLIDVSQPRPVHSGGMRIAVHIHAFYPDLLMDIVRRLGASDLEPDLFVSVPSQRIADRCRTELSACRHGSLTIRVVSNRGRDIGPFVTEFGAELAQYDLVGHFHTKKSVHVDAGTDLVRNWVNHVMETLLGGVYRSAQTIVSAFAEDSRLGIVFADDPHMIGWDKNMQFAKPLAEALGLRGLPEQFFSFPVGTMFWARSAALASLFALGLDWDDYPPEPLPIDGSMLHALERLLPSIVEHAGYGRRVTFAPGVSR